MLGDFVDLLIDNLNPVGIVMSKLGIQRPFGDGIDAPVIYANGSELKGFSFGICDCAILYPLVLPLEIGECGWCKET